MQELYLSCSGLHALRLQASFSGADGNGNQPLYAGVVSITSNFESCCLAFAPLSSQSCVSLLDLPVRAKRV